MRLIQPENSNAVAKNQEASLGALQSIVRLVRLHWLARILLPSVALLILLLCAGCGSFVARRLVQSPNSYPTWFAPDARVTLGFSGGFLTNFPAQYARVGSPEATIRYRVINPADYQFASSSTNWVAHERKRFEFKFEAKLPAPTNQWTHSPRGTVVLLHGYGLAQFSMAPWAIRLAEQGWRCVLVDLRGHGKSTGKKIYFGLKETQDLSLLMNLLEQTNQLVEPLAVLGESYGGALALRWAGVEPRVKSVVTIAPFVVLSNAVMNIRRDYVSWMPQFMVKAGVRQLPTVLGVQPDELNTSYVLQRHPVRALFIAGGDDTIMPAKEISGLCELGAAGSKVLIVPHGTHESVTYFFNDLDTPVAKWLTDCTGR